MWKYNLVKDYGIGLGDNKSNDGLILRNGSTINVNWNITHDGRDRGTEELYRIRVEGEWPDHRVSIWDRIDAAFYTVIESIIDDTVNNDEVIARFSRCCEDLVSRYGTDNNIMVITYNISNDPNENITNVDWYAYMGSIQNRIDIPYSRRIQISDEIRGRDTRRDRVPVYSMSSRNPIGYTSIRRY